AEVGEPDHILDLAPRAIFRRSTSGGEPEPVQRFECRVEVARVAHLQADGLHGVLPAHECKRVVAKVRPEGRELLRPVDRLESENALREIRCAAKVARNNTYVPQLFELNHSSCRVRICPAAVARVAASRKAPTMCPSRCWSATRRHWRRARSAARGSSR